MTKKKAPATKKTIGGAAATKKKPAAKPGAKKPAAKKSAAGGGSLMEDVSNLAIPLALLAARQGLEWYKETNAPKAAKAGKAGGKAGGKATIKAGKATTKAGKATIKAGGKKKSRVGGAGAEPTDGAAGELHGGEKAFSMLRRLLGGSSGDPGHVGGGVANLFPANVIKQFGGMTEIAEEIIRGTR